MAKKTLFIHNPVAPLRGIIANGTIGADGTFLVSNGSGVYWSNSISVGTGPGSGYSGSIGYTGSQGLVGYTGSQGFVGSRGDTGFTGSAGTNGATGFTGSLGVTGFAGSRGFTGSAGFTGSIGFTGSTGFTGSAAKTLSVSADRQTIAYDSSNLPTPTTQTTTFTAYKQNTTSTISWLLASAGGAYVFPVGNYMVFPSQAIRNDAPQSQTLDNASWTKTNGSITSNTVVAPDGTTTADLFTPDATSNTHLLQGTMFNPVASSVNTRMISVYAKANGYSKIRIGISSSNQAYADFDVSTGTVIGGGQTSGAAVPTVMSITNVGNGWFRCAVLATITVVSNILMQVQVLDASGAATYTGDGTSGVYFWGVQCENSSSLGSYLATTTAAVSGYNYVTNLASYSQDITNAVWNADGTTKTGGLSSSAINGGNNAGEFSIGTASNNYPRNNSITPQNGVTYTISAWVWSTGTLPTQLNFAYYNGTAWQLSSNITLTTTPTRQSWTFTSTGTSSAGMGFRVASGATGSSFRFFGFDVKIGSTLQEYVPTTSGAASATISQGDSCYITETNFASARGSTSGILVSARLVDDATLAGSVNLSKVQNGFTGSAGTNGATGFTGSIGAQGTTGFTGSAGAQGITGFTGSSGAQGATGFTGSAGTNGATGFTGSQGSQGVTGFTGSQGTQGVVGFTGSAGAQGTTGFTGSAGTNGATGFTGSAGTNGATGFTGSAGSQGTTGFTGSQGAAGTTGFTGSAGTNGATGFTGSQGVIGFTGSAGTSGSGGANGVGLSSNTQITFNDQNTANGSALFTFSKINNTVTLGQTNSALSTANSGITIYGATTSELKFLTSTAGRTFSDGTALAANASDFSIINKEPGLLTVGTNSAVRITVTAAGLVGIANSSPAKPLHLTGDLLVSNATANSVMLYSNGQIVATGDITAFGSLSDIRLKSNVHIIEHPLDKITKLNGITFNYVNDGGRATGVIAQEILDVLPEAVYKSQISPDDPEQYLVVRYGNIVGLLIEAIKEQQVQINNLVKRVEDLE